MFLNSKQEKAVSFLITVLESRGLEVRYPDIETNHGKVSISEIRWVAVDKMANLSAHIILTKWGGKFKLIMWLPKNPDEGMSAIDSYVIVHNHCLILPNGCGQLSLHKIDSGIFMSLNEMRDYLGY